MHRIASVFREIYVPNQAAGNCSYYSIFVLQVIKISDLRELGLEVAQIPCGSRVSRHRCIFPKAFLFIKARLIAPAGDGDVDATVWAFLVSCKAHDVRQATVFHQKLYPSEQVINVLTPELIIPAPGPVKSGEAVKLWYDVGVLSDQL